MGVLLHAEPTLSEKVLSREGDRADPTGAAAGRAPQGQAAQSRPCSSLQGAATGSRATHGTAGNECGAVIHHTRIVQQLQDSMSSQRHLFLPARAAMMDCQGPSSPETARCLEAKVRWALCEVATVPPAWGRERGGGCRELP